MHETMTARVDTFEEFPHSRFKGAFCYEGTIDGEEVTGSIKWMNLKGQDESGRIMINSGVFVHGPQESGGSEPIPVDPDFAAMLHNGDRDAIADFLSRLLQECSGLKGYDLRVA